jgi:hypothetical protein
MGIPSNYHNFPMEALSPYVDNPLQWQIPALQLFAIDPTSPSFVMGESGMKITIPTGSFSDHSGHIYTRPLKVELTEVTSKALMIMANKSTTSRDEVLESNGMFYLHFQTMEGADVQLIKPLQIEWPIAATVQNPNGIKLYQSGLAATRSYSTQLVQDWLPASKQKLKTKKWQGQNWLTATISSLGWFSFNAPLTKGGSKSMITARYALPEKVVLEQKIAFLVLRDCTSLVRMYPAGDKYSCFNIPVQEPFSIFIAGRSGNQLYGGILPVTNLLHTQKIEVPLSPIDLENSGQNIRMLLAFNG